MKVYCIQCKKRFSGTRRQFAKILKCRRCGTSGQWWHELTPDDAGAVCGDRPFSGISEAESANAEVLKTPPHPGPSFELRETLELKRALAELMEELPDESAEQSGRYRSVKLGQGVQNLGSTRRSENVVVTLCRLVVASTFALIRVALPGIFILLCILTPPIGWIVLWMMSDAENRKVEAYAKLADAGKLGERDLEWLERKLRSRGV